MAPYLFGVLPASCRQHETMRGRTICRRDAGSTYAEPSSAAGAAAVPGSNGSASAQSAVCSPQTLAAENE